MNQFLEAQVIKRSPQDGWFLSHLFTVQEPNKIRPILDGKRINIYIQCHHFTMEEVPTLRKIIEKDDLMAKIDLKDSYIVVPIHQESRWFLSFKHKGVIYHYKFFAFWDECGAQNVLQIDEVCYQTTTREGYSAGILPGWYLFIDLHCQEFLGIATNTSKQIIRSLKEKLLNLTLWIEQKLEETKTCRWIATLLGKLTSLILATGEPLLHARFL